jgi:hypothetical protein
VRDYAYAQRRLVERRGWGINQFHGLIGSLMRAFLSRSDLNAPINRAIPSSAFTADHM